MSLIRMAKTSAPRGVLSDDEKQSSTGQNQARPSQVNFEESEATRSYVRSLFRTSDNSTDNSTGHV